MVETLNAAAAAELVSQHDVDVVDVRDDREWNAGHLPGARHIPLEQLRADPEAYLAHKPILFVCARGVRSLQAAKLAERMGYTQVYNLDGGTSAWSQARLPLVVDAQTIAA
jgi:rhodanese-related sulfurtransferase